ncbi:HXXEE domain-containing protein [Rothia sp. (in: high G+C Gram-positive bacteria)]|uniref:HXXEE domain-containing protein n=1 Tax=Rothia sp. (in: high G+C Gram-positive bacteria) TaxID=1885016 RepID=UPI0032166649
MKVRILSSAPALVGIFSVHNAEEIGYMQDHLPVSPQLLARVGLMPEDYAPRNMAVGTGLITLTAAGILCAPFRNRAVGIAQVGAAGALAVNALAHVGRALREKRYNPGLATAPVMLFSSLNYISRIRRELGMTRMTVGWTTLGAGVLSFPIIIGYLRLARWVIGARAWGK